MGQNQSSYFEHAILVSVVKLYGNKDESRRLTTFCSINGPCDDSTKRKNHQDICASCMT